MPAIELNTRVKVAAFMSNHSEFFIGFVLLSYVTYVAVRFKCSIAP